MNKIDGEMHAFISMEVAMFYSWINEKHDFYLSWDDIKKIKIKILERESLEYNDRDLLIIDTIIMQYIGPDSEVKIKELRKKNFDFQADNFLPSLNMKLEELQKNEDNEELEEEVTQEVKEEITKEVKEEKINVKKENDNLQKINEKKPKKNSKKNNTKNNQDTFIIKKSSAFGIFSVLLAVSAFIITINIQNENIVLNFNKSPLELFTECYEKNLSEFSEKSIGVACAKKYEMRTYADVHKGLASFKNDYSAFGGTVENISVENIITGFTVEIYHYDNYSVDIPDECKKETIWKCKQYTIKEEIRDVWIEYGEKDNFYFNVDIAKEGFKKSDIKWSGLNDNTNWNISNTYVIKILSE